MTTRKDKFWLKSALVLATGVFVMHLPARNAAAATVLGPACVTACCFCVSPQEITCEDADAFYAIRLIRRSPAPR